MSQDLEDDFVDVDVTEKKAPLEPVMIMVFQMKESKPRLSLSIEEEMAKRIAGAGWPRYAVAWSAKGRRFRIVGKVQGPVEAMQFGRGSRVVLRWLPPDGIELERGRRIAPAWEEVDGALYVTMPRFLERQTPLALPAPSAPPAPATPAAAPKKPLDIVEPPPEPAAVKPTKEQLAAARRAVPPPMF